MRQTVEAEPSAVLFEIGAESLTDYFVSATGVVVWWGGVIQSRVMTGFSISCVVVVVFAVFVDH